MTLSGVRCFFCFIKGVGGRKKGASCAFFQFVERVVSKLCFVYCLFSYEEPRELVAFVKLLVRTR